MSETAKIDDALRARILAQPQAILEDPDLMRALVAENDRMMGANIVDLRGIAMERLEARLDRLEDTHRSVIAAAYENLAGTNQVQRAILRMLDPVTFEDFVKNLAGDVADILRVDAVRLVLETTQTGADPKLERLGDVLCMARPGFIDAYLSAGRDRPGRSVTLRQTLAHAGDIYGKDAEYARSEALMKLDLGTGRLPGLLALASEDPQRFKANQATDLLGFFAGVFERAMRRWLA